MNVSLVQATAAMQAQQRYQEVLADNIASSSLPAYRKHDMSFAAIQAGVIGNKTNNTFSASTPVSLPRFTSTTNFTPGNTVFTGVETNMSLEGPGFFEVRLPNGTSAYTRNGEFNINSQGELITASGYTVMGDAGTIQMDLRNPAPITVSANGEVRQGEDLKGKIKVVDFNDPNLLTPISQSCFLATNPSLQTIDATNTTVHQKSLEMANSTPVQEMSSLLSTMRSFEANQRVLQLSDERSGKTISELSGT